MRSCEAARCVATREEEQAVSTAAEGPERPSRKEMRPGATAEEPAVKEKGPICIGIRVCQSQEKISL
jgi:hypothetical protein